MGKKGRKKKEIIPRLSSTTSTQNASPSPARVYLALPPCMQAKRYWRQLMAQAAMIDAVSQCPRLFQRSPRNIQIILLSKKKEILSRAFLLLLPLRPFGTGQAAHIHEEKKRGLSVGRRRPKGGSKPWSFSRKRLDASLCLLSCWQKAGDGFTYYWI
jgi:hypothetical protein